jgi:hypothetical protein
MNRYERADSVRTCCVLTDDVDWLNADFRDGVNRALGRAPRRAFHIGALNVCYGVRRFVMADPGGNMIRFG